MFWTVFFATLLAVYIIGMLVAIGIGISVYHEKKEQGETWIKDDNQALAFLVFTSWLGIGIFLHVGK